MASKAPLVRSETQDVPAVAQAATDGNHVARAPFAGAVSGVTYTPDAAITGANTDTRRVALVNRGQSGAGTTEIAALQFNDDIDAADNDEKAITLSGTAANLNVAEGDILEWTSTAVGDGIADPGGLVKVEFTRSTTPS